MNNSNNNMSGGYFVLAALDAIKPGGLDAYAPAAAATIANHNGTVEAVLNADHQFEGHASVARIVVIRFASRNDAAGWYSSDEYQAVAPLRMAGANTPFVAGFIAAE